MGSRVVGPLICMVLAGAGWGRMGLAAAPDSRELILRAGPVNEQLFSSLRSFVCDEKIERFRGARTDGDDRQLDTVTSTVSFESGMEHYADIRQNARPIPDLASLAGAWSQGEFGTLLRQTEQLLTVETAVPLGFDDLNGAEAAVYEFNVPEVDSPWELFISSQHLHLPFRSRVWVSTDSGEILKILRTSTSIPPQFRISEIQWMLCLQPIEMKGTRWLLPATGEYVVLYSGSNRREWNRLTFSNYHRYGSEVQVRFDVGN